EPLRRVLFKTGLFELMIALILGAALVWVLAKARKYFVKPEPTNRPEIISFTNGLYVFGYLASIFASMLFFDASTKFKLRILSPIYVSLLVLFVAFCLWLWDRRRAIAIALVAVVFGVSMYGQVSALTELRKGGQGYASFQWYDSKAMEYLRALPTSVMIYTDEPGAVYLYTGRGAYVLPDRFDPVTAEARPGFDKGVTQMQMEINAGHAVLALFGSNVSAEDASAMNAGLHLGFKGSGAEIYTAAP
ncbi:MAG TPA: hypothetical protein VHM28_07605, partial [Anaerolineales bacterium]|nr:hypothetical protein [Anaerolineales bacterium]